MSKTTLGSFVNQFKALIDGDTAQAQAEKAWRQAENGITTHIAALNGKTLDKTEAVVDATEELRLATLNHGKPITNRDEYVKNLFEAKDKLSAVEEDLVLHGESIVFLKERLDALKTD